MKVAIMQPYLFPYIGYFQLIHAVDRFVIHDDVQYVKGGWINRNRFLQGAKDEIFTWSLRKDSSRMLIRERFFSEHHAADGTYFLNRMRAAYQKAPFFDDTFPLLEKAVAIPELNISKKITAILRLICDRVSIHTPFIVSSDLPTDKALRAEARVIRICQHQGATHYVNPIGGMELYSRASFATCGLQLSFLKTRPIEYSQFEAPFVPHLSIIDVMMFNSVEKIGRLLDQYDLV